MLTEVSHELTMRLLLGWTFLLPSYVYEIYLPLVVYGGALLDSQIVGDIVRRDSRGGSNTVILKPRHV